MATSKLQRYTGDLLDKKLSQFRIRENYRPDWLVASNGSKLEIDFYIEELNIAIEVQGLQHYEYVEFFHKTRDEFTYRMKLDEEKRDLCLGHGCKFIEIITEIDINIFIDEQLTRLNLQPKYFYQDVNEKEEYRYKKRIKTELKRLRKQACINNNSLPDDYKQLEAIIANDHNIKPKLVDPNLIIQSRRERCKKKLQLYKFGNLDASPEKIANWLRIVNGEDI